MLQIQTVKPDCLAVLTELMNIGELEDFRLAGGTALSLRLGHRISIDIDLFTNKLFDPEVLQTFLQDHLGDRIALLGSNRYGVFASIDEINVDFLYRHEKFMDIQNLEDGFRIASIEDISAMKILSAANRGSKKDYYDLYELLNVYTFAELINFFTSMYPNHKLGGIVRPLANFADAEPEDDPISLKTILWTDVKEKLSIEINDFVRDLQEKKKATETERQKAIEEVISRKKNKN